MKKTLKLYWSKSKPNFGDCLSPMLVERVSGQAVEPAPINQADVIAVGSLLQRKKEHFLAHRLHVWGAGFIDSQPLHKSRHHYHAVRGKYSESLISNIGDVAYGDPALLVDCYFAELRSTEKRWRIGLIPHYKDKDNQLVKSLCAANDDVIEIDIFSPAETFIKQLTQCEVIFSSAMHGLIVADSFGIPNGWIKLSDALRGGDFKFGDYYSVFGGAAVQPLKLGKQLVDTGYIEVSNGYSRPGIEQIKAALVDSFPSI